MGVGMKEAWYGVNHRWPLEHVPRAMISYNSVRRLKKPWHLKTPLMMDSGAYSVILLYGRYPYSVEEYAGALGAWRPDVAWTMDYPCEPAVLAKGGYTIASAQAKTNENTMHLWSLKKGVSTVIQGWAIRDYLLNLDMVKDAGLLTERLGIGTLCRRGQSAEIARIVTAIHKNVPGWVKLHGFGVKVHALTPDVRGKLYSADSSSWAFPAFRRYRGDLRPVSKDLVGIPVLKAHVAKTEALLLRPTPMLDALAEAAD